MSYHLAAGQANTTVLSAGTVLVLSAEVDVRHAALTTLHFLLVRLTRHPLGAVRAVGVLARYGHVSTCCCNGVLQTDDLVTDGALVVSGTLARVRGGAHST